MQKAPDKFSEVRVAAKATHILSSAISIAVLLQCFYFFVSYIFTDLQYEATTDKYFYPFCCIISFAAPLLFRDFFKGVFKYFGYAADISARYFLGYILFLYSIKKILGNMFSLSLSTLDTPLGATSGFTLAWRFFGFSWKFDLLIALSRNSYRLIAAI